MCMYFYSVTYYSDSKQHEHGIICGENYSNVTNLLIKYYGEEEVIEFTLKYLCDRPLAIFPNQYYDTIEELLQKENEI